MTESTEERTTVGTETKTEAERDDPEGRLIAAVHRLERAEDAEPHANADAEAEYAGELVALAARALVRQVEASDSRPVGWDDEPVGKLYRKKPIALEARQVCSPLGRETAAWCGSRYDDTLHQITVQTLEGPLAANSGDWIVKGTRGEFWPVRSDIFDETYEPATEPAATLASLPLKWRKESAEVWNGMAPCIGIEQVRAAQGLTLIACADDLEAALKAGAER
jgi:hypothetical protein